MYEYYFFRGDRDFGQEFVSSRHQYGNILFCSAPRRERGWGLSERSEKSAIFLYFKRYSPIILRIIMNGEVD